MDDWTRAVAEELGVDLNTLDTNLDRAQLIALAKDVAHFADRPTAAITAFLVGYSAALHGGNPESVSQATSSARMLARSWRDERDQEGIGGES
ncbi:MAG: DUF6457 domain-containing protein [Candidatus Nanopelagicales bacterium]